MGKDTSNRSNRSKNSNSKNKKQQKNKKSKFLGIQKSSQDQPKRRLRKFNKKDQSEEQFIPQLSDKQQDQEQFQSQDESQFDQQEDQDRKHSKNQKSKSKSKSNKKSKGKKQNKNKHKKQSKQKDKKSKKSKQKQIQREKNQKLTAERQNKFQSNIMQVQKIPSKQPKKQKKSEKKNNQEPKVQKNLHQMFSKINEKKKREKQNQPKQQLIKSSSKKNNENKNPQQQQEENNSLMVLKKKEDYYNRLQGNLSRNLSQKELLQKVYQLSLQSIEKQKQKKKKDLQKFFQDDNQQIDINEYKFQNIHKETQKPISIRGRNIFKQSSVQKSQQDIPNKKSPGKKEAPKKSATKKSSKKPQTKNEGPLGGEVIIFTGQFQPYSKDQLIQLCQKLGATTPASFSVKSTVLLQGSYIIDQYKRRIAQDINTTGKSRKAQQKNIRIVPNKDIDDFFIQKTGKSLEQHFNKNPNKLDSFVQKKKPDDSNAIMQIQIIDKNQIKNKQRGFMDLWTEKYKPKNLDQVIGQGAQIRQLREWLTDWEDVVLKGNKKDVEAQRGFLPTGNMNSRAALISGDPGIGKTTTARLLAQQLGYNVAQFNASDIRNKKGVQLLQTNSYGLHQSSYLMKKLIIMDQVDGMSKGDRGGITQIINMIKNTTIPIICICNDRQSQKIRSLAGHCLDIKFHKPDKRMILKRLQAILQKEGGKATDLVLNRIIQTFQNDMRQILTYLQLMFKTKIQNQLQIKDIEGTHKFSKDSAVLLTHFDASRKLLNRLSLNNMTLRDKLDCFFIDSDMVPLMVHQNYLGSMKKQKLNKKQFHDLVKATDAFVLSDQMNSKIRSQQEWGLMPAYGFMATVYPCEMVSNSIGFPQFPSWLGKFSSQRKNKRLIKQLKQVIQVATPTSNKSIRYGIGTLLYLQINYLLKNEQIQETLNFLQDYNLNPTIMNQVLLPLQYNPGKGALLSDVPTATKTKLTRQFNKRHEQLKLRGKVKKGKQNVEHLKYNQVLEQMQDQGQINQQDEQQNNENNENKENNSVNNLKQQIVMIENNDKKSKKNTKKQTKGTRKK